MLAKAAGSGRDVRVILDQNTRRPITPQPYNTLTTGKVAVHWANPTYKCNPTRRPLQWMGLRPAIMTLNLTPEDYSTTRDFAVDYQRRRRCGLPSRRTFIDSISPTQQLLRDPATILCWTPHQLPLRTARG